MIGVVIEQAFKSRCAAWRLAPVRLRRFCTLTCNRIPGMSAMHVDVQSAQPSSRITPWCSAMHVNVQPMRLPPRQRVLHVDVQPAAHVAGDLHVNVQSPFLLSQEIWPGDFGLTKDILHVNVQPPRHYRRKRALHVDVQNPFLRLLEERPDSFGATEMSLHVNVQRLRRNRQRWAGALSPHSKQKASRQLRPRQNLGLSHFGARK